MAGRQAGRQGRVRGGQRARSGRAEAGRKESHSKGKQKVAFIVMVVVIFLQGKYED